MFFSRTTKYAIRSLVYITVKGKTVSLQELSRELEIPFDYLKKVLIKLQKAGILRSIRGKAGGYYLAKTPNTITVADIVNVFESVGFEECAFSYCEEKCMAYKGMMLLEKKLMEALNSITLSDFQKKGGNTNESISGSRSNNASS